MKVLVINPGATSTKVAVFEEEQELLKKSIVHTAQELEGFDRVIVKKKSTAKYPWLKVSIMLPPAKA